MLRTFVVSIGRAVGGGPEELSEEAWTEYIVQTFDTTCAHAHNVYFRGTGLGTNPYATPPSEEDAYTIVGDIFAYNVGDLHDALAALAPRFEQRSIALTIGDTRFPGEED